jgi:hypothetical protein
MFIGARRVKLRFDSSSLSLPLRWLALAAAVLALAACSTIKLGYNNAETLLLYSLNDYLDLSPEQQQLARERVNAVHDWHRATQLPDYAAFVRHAQGKLDGEVSADDVLQFNEGLNARLAALGDRVGPDFARLALTLTPAQLERLEKKMGGDTRKARREFGRGDARDALEQRVKKYAERADFWLGRLTPEQLEIVRESLAARPTATSYWIEERERRQRELVMLLRRIQTERPSEAVATGWIQRYFAELASPPQPERRARAAAYRQHRADLIAQLINRATPQQRTLLNRRLRGFAEDFTALAGRNGGRAG